MRIIVCEAELMSSFLFLSSKQHTISTTPHIINYYPSIWRSTSSLTLTGWTPADEEQITEIRKLSSWASMARHLILNIPYITHVYSLYHLIQILFQINSWSGRIGGYTYNRSRREERCYPYFLHRLSQWWNFPNTPDASHLRQHHLLMIGEGDDYGLPT